MANILFENINPKLFKQNYTIYLNHFISFLNANLFCFVAVKTKHTVISVEILKKCVFSMVWSEYPKVTYAWKTIIITSQLKMLTKKVLSRRKVIRFVWNWPSATIFSAVVLPGVNFVTSFHSSIINLVP